QLPVAPIAVLALPAAPIEEGARVARVVQHPQGTRVLKLPPEDLALVRSVSDATGKGQPLLAKRLDRRDRRPCSAKCREEDAHRLLHLLVRIEHGASRGIVD